MTFTKSTLAAALAATLGLASATASALPIYEYSYFEDDDLDTLVMDRNGNGLLDVGDSLAALLDFTKITENNQFWTPTGNGYYLDPARELTGYTVIDVTNVTSLGFGQYYITYGTNAAFTAQYGAGAMVALFEDTPGNDLDLSTQCTSLTATCLGNATDGTLWATFGFGDADDQWTSIGSNNFAGAAVGGATSKYSTVNFALSVLTNNIGKDVVRDSALDCVSGIFACAGDGKVDVIGSGDILGGAGLDQSQSLHVRSDTDFLMHVDVPEPAPLALLGLGLLAAAGSRRRK